MKSSLKKNGRYDLYIKDLNYCNKLVNNNKIGEFVPHVTKDKVEWKIHIFNKNFKHKFDPKQSYDEKEIINFMDILTLTQKTRPKDSANNIYIKWTK